jgi:hypothetical protein
LITWYVHDPPRCRHMVIVLPFVISIMKYKKSLNKSDI